MVVALPAVRSRLSVGDEWRSWHVGLESKHVASFSVQGQDKLDRSRLSATQHSQLQREERVAEFFHLSFDSSLPIARVRGRAAKMRWLLSFLVLGIYYGAVQALSSAGNKLLVIQEDASEKELYSTFWSDLECEYAGVVLVWPFRV